MWCRPRPGRVIVALTTEPGEPGETAAIGPSAPDLRLRDAVHGGWGAGSQVGGEDTKVRPVDPVRRLDGRRGEADLASDDHESLTHADSSDPPLIGVRRSDVALAVEVAPKVQGTPLIAAPLSRAVASSSTSYVIGAGMPPASADRGRSASVRFRWPIRSGDEGPRRSPRAGRQEPAFPSDSRASACSLSGVGMSGHSPAPGATGIALSANAIPWVSDATGDVGGEEAQAPIRRPPGRARPRASRGPGRRDNHDQQRGEREADIARMSTRRPSRRVWTALPRRRPMWACRAEGHARAQHRANEPAQPASDASNAT